MPAGYEIVEKIANDMALLIKGVVLQVVMDDVLNLDADEVNMS